jgi:single-strand DNA-binding protein
MRDKKNVYYYHCGVAKWQGTVLISRPPVVRFHLPLFSNINNGVIVASVNKVVLIGNLGKDPELRYTQGGKSVTSFSLATTNKYKGADGTSHSDTEWHNIVAWGKLGEIANQYLKKGRSAYIEGTIKTQTWDDKDGNKRYKTNIIANTIQFLSERKTTSNNTDTNTSEELPF